MAMMTMAQFLTTEAPDRERAIAKLFVGDARSGGGSQLFRAIPWENRPQAGIFYNKQTAIASTAARAVGETYTASTGTVEPGFEPMKIYGGIAQFDAFQVATGSGSRRALEIAGKVESARRNFTADFIKGDSATDIRVVNGLQNRLTDTSKNLYAHGTAAFTITAGLAALDMARDCTHIICGRGLHRRITVAAHNTAVGGYITRGKDEIGAPVVMLFDKPLIPVENDEADTEILDFSETGSTTSMYFVSFRPGMCYGAQVKPPTVEDLGRDPTNGTQYNAVVDWYANFVIEHDRAVVRMSGITDAAVTL